MPRPRYYWRKLTEDERAEVLSQRKRQHRPWHSPPRRKDDGRLRYHVTAACFEHRPHIGKSPERMSAFSAALLRYIESTDCRLYAWCVLPNHYHLLVETDTMEDWLKDLGKLHGRQSFVWNGEESMRGRKVFFRAVERAMRSDRHFWSTLNYVHHNPVHHGYVAKWADWPWSSASDFLRSIQREEAERIWTEYPLLDYGKGWDAPEL